MYAVADALAQPPATCGSGLSTASGAHDLTTGPQSSPDSTASQRHASMWRWLRLAVLLAVLSAVAALAAPARFGGAMTYAVVTGHSMEPVMHDGA